MTTRHILTMAALHCAYHLGIRQKAYSIERKCGMNSIELLAWVQPHLAKIVEANEIAEGIAMSKPSNVEAKLYGGFGKWLGDYINNNEELPKEDVLVNVFVNVVSNVYVDLLNRDQLQTLAKKIKEL